MIEINKDKMKDFLDGFLCLGRKHSYDVRIKGKDVQTDFLSGDKIVICLHRQEYIALYFPVKKDENKRGGRFLVVRIRSCPEEDDNLRYGEYKKSFGLINANYVSMKIDPTNLFTLQLYLFLEPFAGEAIEQKKKQAKSESEKENLYVSGILV